VFLCSVEEVFVDTGERNYSGSGRNMQTMRRIDNLDNYHFLLPTASVSNLSGKEMATSAYGQELIGPYLAEFSQYSEYHVTIRSNTMKPLITTRSGGQVVGAIWHHNTSSLYQTSILITLTSPSSSTKLIAKIGDLLQNSLHKYSILISWRDHPADLHLNQLGPEGKLTRCCASACFDQNYWKWNAKSNQ
jgi:hypothetical protein